MAMSTPADGIFCYIAFRCKATGHAIILATLCGNVEAHAIHLPDQFLVWMNPSYLLLIFQNADHICAIVSLNRFDTQRLYHLFRYRNRL